MELLLDSLWLELTATAEEVEREAMKGERVLMLEGVGRIAWAPLMAPFPTLFTIAAILCRAAPAAMSSPNICRMTAVVASDNICASSTRLFGNSALRSISLPPSSIIEATVLLAPRLCSHPFKTRTSPIAQGSSSSIGSSDRLVSSWSPDTGSRGR